MRFKPADVLACFCEAYEKCVWEYLYNGREKLWLKKPDNSYKTVVER